MTSLNKINKAFDSLKKVIGKSSDESDIQKKKVAVYLSITELVCKSQEKSTLLPYTIVSLIQQLEDADSNTRIVIEESLNKIIRVCLSKTNYVAKILIALLKVLGKSTNERCIRAALWRFSELSHLMRPQKGRIYAKTLVPMIVKISSRKEESVVKTLSDSLPNIVKHIGLFATDRDNKVLLDSFMINLASDSAEIRRAGASCIVSVCKYSKKPDYLFSYVLVQLVDFVTGIKNPRNSDRAALQGYFAAIRQIIPYLKQLSLPNHDDQQFEYLNVVDELLRIVLSIEYSLDEKYGAASSLQMVLNLCVKFAKCRDHNVITSALETFYILLQNGPPLFIHAIRTTAHFSSSANRSAFPIFGSTISIAGQSDVISLSSTTGQMEDGFFSRLFIGNNREQFSGSNDLFEEQTMGEQHSRTEEWISKVHEESNEEENNDLASSSLLDMNVSHFANSDDEESSTNWNADFVSSFNSSLIDVNLQNTENEELFFSENANGSYISNSISILSKYSFESLTTDDKESERCKPNDRIGLCYCLSEFLVNEFLLDKNQVNRVSIVSLALNSVAQLFKICPTAAFIPIKFDSEMTEEVVENKYHLLDVVLSFSDHPDPQIRGHVRTVVGNFMASSIVENNYFIDENASESRLDDCLFDHFVSVMLKGLKDESSVCIKCTLQGLAICLKPILKSTKYHYARNLLDVLFVLMENSYWLIKVKLVEIVGCLPFDILYYIRNDSSYQNKYFRRIIMMLIGDPDGRVRNAVARSLLPFLENAYYPIDNFYEPIEISCAKKFHCAIDILQDHSDMKQTKDDYCLYASLSRVIDELTRRLIDAPNKYVANGCCEALSLLVDHYPPVEHASSWQCCFTDEVSGKRGGCVLESDLFGTVLSLLTNPPLILDIDAHLYLLKIATSLFAAICIANVQMNRNTDPLKNSAWSYLSNGEVVSLGQLLLRHIVRVIRILNDVVTEDPLKGVTTKEGSNRAVMPLPIDEPLLLNQDTTKYLQQVIDSKNSSQHNDEKYSFSHYTHIPWYVKLRELLHSAHNNYKVTLKAEASEKFVTFIKITLDCLSMMLDYTTVMETERICKELLLYIRQFVVFLPAKSIHCIVQLLKNLFSVNIIGEHMAESDDIKRSVVPIAPVNEGFYTSCIENHFYLIEELINFYSNDKNNSYVLRSLEKNRTNMENTIAKHLKYNVNSNLLPSYIKLFESNVIQSLELYTVSSDAELQGQVLSLLTELIQLKVNYCLLDSEQAFIKFVLSQFQSIEETQLIDAEKLLPYMFNFLMNLAYEKHSKPVMSVPKIIQLCGSLIASGQSASIYLLSIEPIIHHIFQVCSMPDSNTIEMEQLETERDVLFTMLLRFINHVRSYYLISLILRYSDGDLKLARSKRVLDSFFKALTEKTIDPDSHNFYCCLSNLIMTLHPESFDEDYVKNFLFYILSNEKDCKSKGWVASVIAFVLVIVGKYNEESLDSIVKTVLKDVENKAEYLLISSEIPETVLFKFLCEIVLAVLNDVHESRLEVDEADVAYSLRLISELIVLLTYITQSGNFPKLTKEVMELQKDVVERNSQNILFKITESCRNFITNEPLIFKWFDFNIRLMTSVNMFQKFSKFLLDDDIFEMKYEKKCISISVIRTGLFLLIGSQEKILLEHEQILQWLLENNFNSMLKMMGEKPIWQILRLIQSSPSASRLFLGITQRYCDEFIDSDNDLTQKMLQCLEFIHPKVSGRTLLFCCQPVLLNHEKHLTAQLAADIAQRNVEALLQLENKEDIEEQLNQHDFETLIQNVDKVRIKSRNFVELLYALATKWYNISIKELEGTRRLCYEDIESQSINMDWFVAQVQQRCCVRAKGDRKLALLLSHLRLKYICTIMRSPNFNINLLVHCFDLGMQLTIQNLQSVPVDKTSELQISDLYLAARLATLRHLHDITSPFPRTHQVYYPMNREVRKREMQYSERIDKIIAESDVCGLVASLLPAVSCYVSSLHPLSKFMASEFIISTQSYQLLSDFVLLALQVQHRRIRHGLKPDRTLSLLECCVAVLSVEQIRNSVDRITLASIVNSFFVIAEYHIDQYIPFSLNLLVNELSKESDEILDSAHSGQQISSLLSHFMFKVPISVYENDVSLDHLMLKLLIVLSQSPLLYNYLRIPDEVWKHIVMDDISLEDCVTVNTIPEQLLQDPEILQHFVSRLSLIGWSSRFQFEECWIYLLTALNTVSETNIDEEMSDSCTVLTIAVNSISSLLVQTMYDIPGSKISFQLYHISRNRNLDIKQSKWKTRLHTINEIFVSHTKRSKEFVCLYEHANINIERLHNHHKYYFNQISVEYLMSQCKNYFQEEMNFQYSYNFQCLRSQFLKRQSKLRGIGIDTNSCVYFLMDFYSRWILKSDNNSAQLLIEIINSMLIMSDLFVELSQFSWLLDTSIILWRKYAAADDTVKSYLIVCILKSSSMFISLETNVRKQIIRILKSGLNCKSKRIQTDTLHGLLYMLECVFKKNVLSSSELINHEYEEQILSLAIGFVLENLDVDNTLRLEEEEAICLISVAFYMLNYNSCYENTNLIVDRLCKLAVRACKLKQPQVHIAIMQGFYNLILSENISVRDYDNVLVPLIKEITSISECTVSIAVVSLQILMAVMYTSGDFEETRSDFTFDTEKMVVRTEKLAIFFDRIKKGSANEAQIVCAILPQLIRDFFHVSEVLNKITIEFLSSDQFQLQIMADVVFKVFRIGIEQSQEQLIADWMLSLLNHFMNHQVTTNLLLCLTCLFVSVSSNPWLANIFPILTVKSEVSEYEKQKLLCLSAIQFYSQLTNDLQKKSFIDKLKKITSRNSDSSFSQVFKLIHNKCAPNE